MDCRMGSIISCRFAIEVSTNLLPILFLCLGEDVALVPEHGWKTWKHVHKQNLEVVIECKLFSHEFHGTHGAVLVVNTDQNLSHCPVLPRKILAI